MALPEDSCHAIELPGEAQPGNAGVTSLHYPVPGQHPVHCTNCSSPTEQEFLDLRCARHSLLWNSLVQIYTPQSRWPLHPQDTEIVGLRKTPKSRTHWHGCTDMPICKCPGFMLFPDFSTKISFFWNKMSQMMACARNGSKSTILWSWALWTAFMWSKHCTQPSRTLKSQFTSCVSSQRNSGLWRWRGNKRWAFTNCHQEHKLYSCFVVGYTWLVSIM